MKHILIWFIGHTVDICSEFRNASRNPGYSTVSYGPAPKDWIRFHQIRNYLKCDDLRIIAGAFNLQYFREMWDKIDLSSANIPVGIIILVNPADGSSIRHAASTVDYTQGKLPYLVALRNSHNRVYLQIDLQSWNINHDVEYDPSDIQTIQRVWQKLIGRLPLTDSQMSNYIKCIDILM